MLRIILLSAVVALFLFVMFGLPLPATGPPGPLLAGAEAPAEITALIARACQDCHSHNTRWPWYARIAPLRWYVTRDIEKARRALNFSEWDQYSPLRQRTYLARMTDVTHLHRMPPPAYIFGHLTVGLKEADHKTLEQWARRETDRLKETTNR